jgi:hypothetical protein
MGSRECEGVVGEDAEDDDDVGWIGRCTEGEGGRVVACRGNCGGDADIERPFTVVVKGTGGIEDVVGDNEGP